MQLTGKTSDTRGCHAEPLHQIVTKSLLSWHTASVPYSKADGNLSVRPHILSPKLLHRSMWYLGYRVIAGSQSSPISILAGYLFATFWGPVLKSIQLPEPLSHDVERRLCLANHLQRLRMRGANPSCPLPWWRAQGKSYLFSVAANYARCSYTLHFRNRQIYLKINAGNTLGICVRTN
jgi:hypothetical protein